MTMPAIPQLHSILWDSFYSDPRTFFKIKGDSVLFSGNKLSMANKPLILKLLRKYLQHGTSELSKAQLVDCVYTEGKKDPPSFRLQESHNRNIVKLLSRARALFNKTFKMEGISIEWFAYNPNGRSYLLYRFRRKSPYEG